MHGSTSYRMEQFRDLYSRSNSTNQARCQSSALQDALYLLDGWDRSKGTATCDT